MYRFYRSPTAPDKIYSSSLKTLCLGHGMWYPEPHESGESQIGDVGFLKEGAFIRLFNLDTSAPEKKVTYWDPPFTISNPPPPGSFKIDQRARPLAPRRYCSHGVQSQRYHASANLSPGAGVSAGIGAEYTCKASQGAVLALKSEAQAQTIFENLDLKEYVLRHHESWCAYVRDVLRQDVKASAIVMVSGWVKTGPDWAAAAFSKASSSTSTSLNAGAGDSAGVDAGFEHKNSVHGPEMHRHGDQYMPKEAETASQPARDQSVFLKRYKVRRRLGIVRKIVAGAGYHRLPPGDGKPGGDEDGHIERGMDLDEGKGESEVPDLVDVLLEYMFETTAVETAVASDDDVAAIIGPDCIEDFSCYLRALQPPVEIDRTDPSRPTGFLSKVNVIRHQRKRSVASGAIRNTDSIKWPNISSENASVLDDIRVLVGPTLANARPVKLKAFTFPRPSHAPNSCRCYALSPDGKLLAASWDTPSIVLWRLSDGMMVQHLRDDPRGTKRASSVTCLAFSPDSTTLFADGSDKIVVAWNIRTGIAVPFFGPHQSDIRAIACSPYEPLVVTVGVYGGMIYVWDRVTGQRLSAFPDATALRGELTFLPPTLDGSHIYIRDASSAVVYNLRSRTSYHRLEFNSGMARGAGALARSVSHHGDRVLVQAKDPGLDILNARNHKLCVAIRNQHIRFPAGFSPDDTQIYATSASGIAIQTFLSQTGEPSHRFEASDRVAAGAYSPDGAYLAFCTLNGAVEVHDPVSGSFLARADAAAPSFGHRAITFSKDSASLIVCGQGELRVLNVLDMMRAR